MEKLTHQEEEVMLVIWEKGRGIVKDFVEKLPEPRPPYTTVASVVKNLERKGYLSSEKIGNTYLYTPASVSTNTKANSCRVSSRAIFPTPTRRWSPSSPTRRNSRKRTCDKSSP